MKNFNLSTIMKKAWSLVRRFGYNMSTALKLAWADTKKVAEKLAEIKEECHTWFGWKQLGFEVIHESVALFKVTVNDAKTKNGTRVLSYFGASQVAPVVE